VVAADSCESMGLRMVHHSGKSMEKLRKISASWVTISNPVDMSAITPILGPVEAYKAVVEILLQDEGVDAVACHPPRLAQSTSGRVWFSAGAICPVSP